MSWLSAPYCGLRWGGWTFPRLTHSSCTTSTIPVVMGEEWPWQCQWQSTPSRGQGSCYRWSTRWGWEEFWNENFFFLKKGKLYLGIPAPLPPPVLLVPLCRHRLLLLLLVGLPRGFRQERRGACAYFQDFSINHIVMEIIHY